MILFLTICQEVQQKDEDRLEKVFNNTNLEVLLNGTENQKQALRQELTSQLQILLPNIKPSGNFSPIPAGDGIESTKESEVVEDIAKNQTERVKKLYELVEQAQQRQQQWIEELQQQKRELDMKSEAEENRGIFPFLFCPFLSQSHIINKGRFQRFIDWFKSDDPLTQLHQLSLEIDEMRENLYPGITA